MPHLNVAQNLLSPIWTMGKTTRRRLWFLLSFSAYVGWSRSYRSYHEENNLTPSTKLFLSFLDALLPIQCCFLLLACRFVLQKLGFVELSSDVCVCLCVWLVQTRSSVADRPTSWKLCYSNLDPVSSHELSHTGLGNIVAHRDRPRNETNKRDRRRTISVSQVLSPMPWLEDHPDLPINLLLTRDFSYPCIRVLFDWISSRIRVLIWRSKTGKAAHLIIKPHVKGPNIYMRIWCVPRHIAQKTSKTSFEALDPRIKPWITIEVESPHLI